jgi:TonB family protein
MAAQSEPVLTSANIPKYPPLARQARVEGVVRLAFTLPANGTEPTNVEVVSGHTLLKSAAVENVKTWRFENPYAVERRYETTFEYRLLSGRRVTFESFGHVEVVIDVPEPTVTY